MLFGCNRETHREAGYGFSEDYVALFLVQRRFPFQRVGIIVSGHIGQQRENRTAYSGENHYISFIHAALIKRGSKVIRNNGTAKSFICFRFSYCLALFLFDIYCRYYLYFWLFPT